MKRPPFPLKSIVDPVASTWKPPTFVGLSADVSLEPGAAAKANSSCQFKNQRSTSSSQTRIYVYKDYIYETQIRLSAPTSE